MPWVKFVEEFSYKPKPQVTQVYKAPGVYLVTSACARAAIDSGKAFAAERPSKGSANGGS